MISSSYSHAAPYIRRELCYAAYAADRASTQRAKREATAKMYGLALALEIMSRSKDQTPVPGIGDVETLPQDAVTLARRFLGYDADEILGQGA